MTGGGCACRGRVRRPSASRCGTHHCACVSCRRSPGGRRGGMVTVSCAPLVTAGRFWGGGRPGRARHGGGGAAGLERAAAGQAPPVAAAGDADRTEDGSPPQTLADRLAVEVRRQVSG